MGIETGEARQNPRTRRVREVILSSAADVLLTRGAHEVTASRVAEEADVARTTVYRHWPDRRSLLLATIDALTTPHRPTTCSGSLVDDVVRVLTQLRTRLVTRDVRSVFGALAVHAELDEAFGDAQRRFVHQLTQPTVGVLEEAQRRGDLDVDVDCTFEATLLAGPILHEHLGRREEITDGFIDEIARRWLATHDLS